MSGTLGEEIYTAGRYIKHPAGSATNDLQDGRPLDAGSAQIIDNDLTVLARENVRHLVWDAGFGKPKSLLSDSGRGYAGLDDIQGAPDSTEYGSDNLWAAISWDPRTSRHYGPIFCVDDRSMADVGFGLRSIRVDVDCSSATGSSLTLFVALTNGFQYPNEGRLVFLSTTPGAGRSVKTFTLSMATILESRASRRCRPNGGGATTYSQVLEVFLWVGWRATDANDAVLAISAFEIGGDR